MTTRTTENLSINLRQGIMKCITYSWLVGLAINAGLMGLVILSTAVQANEVSPNTDLTRFEQLSELESGQLVFRQPEGHYLASLTVDTNVEIDISGLLARVKVSQTFANPTQDWQEGIYVFPLPETAAVDRLWMRIGERIIEGEIHPKKQAKKIYQQAKASGKRASLVEQQRPNMFTSSVANIAPGEQITVIIEYQQTVQQDQGEFKLRFPMVVAPRYIPGTAISNTEEISHFNGSGWAVNTDQVPDASHITPPMDITQPNHLSLNVLLAAGFPLMDVSSAYHQIEEVVLTDDTRKLQLIGKVPADRDFELTWQAKDSNAPTAALFKQTKNGQDYALLMLTPPKQQLKKTVPRELVFVIDTSGSMDGTSIKQAKKALQYGLAKLKPQDKFNIIRFSDDVESVFKHSRLANRNNLDIAYDFVDGLHADGGTEMLPALSMALAGDEQSQGLRQIVFLTDGSIGNEDELFNEIKQNLGNSRLFTVGIGSAPNSHFMNRAAKYGRGTHSYIGDQAEVREKMQALFNKLAHPVLTNITVDIAGSSGVEIWPQSIPDLYTGEPLMLVMKAKSLPTEITINGDFSQQAWHKTLTFNGGAKSEAVSVLWAR
ncbi:MAG: marine proteobacterial sortase target protein, partial [Proteobacteria bacterium]|nr:marine proteobacterial sortase target protein [Pseudomonadota bacterium]